jgi:hypothetical protein
MKTLVEIPDLPEEKRSREEKNLVSDFVPQNGIVYRMSEGSGTIFICGSSCHEKGTCCQGPGP